MRDPLPWNTLDEAATWLQEKTGEEWSTRRVLDRALQIPATQPPQPQLSEVTLLCAIPPRDFDIAQRRVAPLTTTGEPQIIDVRVPWQPLPLFAHHVKELLVHGEAIVGESMGLVPDKPGVAFRGQIDPPLTVTLAMVGIVGQNLALFFAEAPASAAGARPTPGADADEEIAAWFDPVHVAALEKMFPAAKGQWKSWAERASDNGLIAARTTRGLFNPYLAARWFLRRGLPGWDQERVSKVLAAGLPTRSQEMRNRFLPPPLQQERNPFSDL
jgi:hypothetical protein